MEEKTCETCRHFYRHYAKGKNETYHPLALGHCAKPRLRNRMAEAPACPRWEAIPEWD